MKTAVFIYVPYIPTMFQYRSSDHHSEQHADLSTAQSQCTLGAWHAWAKWRLYTLFSLINVSLYLLVISNKNKQILAQNPNYFYWWNFDQ